MSTRTGARTKGWIKNNENSKKMSFQFNPTGLSYSRGTTYAEISTPGMPYQDTQFVRGNPRNFSVSLFLFDNEIFLFPYSFLITPTLGLSKSILTSLVVSFHLRQMHLVIPDPQ